MIGFQNAMTGIFGEFLHGNGVVRCDTPSDLYALMDILRDTTFNFFNLNATSDAKLIAMVGSKNPRYMDTSRDISPAGFGDKQKLPIDILMRERCLYYYMIGMKDSGFKGFPAFFHVRFDWSDDIYSISQDLLDATNAPKEIFRQIEVFYPAGLQPLVLNEFNPLTMQQSVEVINSPWKLIRKGEQGEEFSPDLLVSTINENIGYPVCTVSNAVISTLKAMQGFVHAQKEMEHFVNNGLFWEMHNAMINDDPYGLQPEEKAYRVVDIVRGQAVLVIPNMGVLQEFANYMDYLAKGDPSKLNLKEYFNGDLSDEDFPLYFTYDPTFADPVLFKYVPDGLHIVEFKEISGYLEEIRNRYEFTINMLKPALISYPLYGTVVPPKFIHSIRDIMYSDIKAQKENQ